MQSGLSLGWLLLRGESLVRNPSAARQGEGEATACIPRAWPHGVGCFRHWHECRAEGLAALVLISVPAVKGHAIFSRSFLVCLVHHLSFAL